MSWPNSVYYVDEYTKPTGLLPNLWAQFLLQGMREDHHKYKVTRKSKQKYEVHLLSNGKMIGTFASQTTAKIAIRMFGD